MHTLEKKNKKFQISWKFEYFHKRIEIWLIDKVKKGQRLKNNFYDILVSGKIVWGPKRPQWAGPG